MCVYLKRDWLMRKPIFAGSNGAAGLMVATSKDSVAGGGLAGDGVAGAVCAFARVPVQNSAIATALTAQHTARRCLEARFMKVPLCLAVDENARTGPLTVFDAAAMIRLYH